MTARQRDEKYVEGGNTMQVEKTVFISYRRTNIYMARAVYQDLTAHGYDCFLDYESIDAGEFERVIKNQIAARAHFIVVLTPSALERCSDPKDWLRREIEWALQKKRNIVPLMFEGFSFKDVEKYLVGKLAVLPNYNAMEVPATYFEAAMERLRTRFLSKPIEVKLEKTPEDDQEAVDRAKDKEDSQPEVSEKQLSAEQWFERGYTSGAEGNTVAAISAYSESIRLNPKDALAHYNRGIHYVTRGNLSGAIADFDATIRLTPDDEVAHHKRGHARKQLGDLDGAVADFKRAIALSPEDATAYVYLADCYYERRQYKEALRFYEACLDLPPSGENRDQIRRRVEEMLRKR